MDWRPYCDRCHEIALDPETVWCPACGHQFLRCLAFTECKSLVSPREACPVCIAPALMIDAGAVVQSKIGERVSVPLVLRNASPAARPIWVKRIVKREARVDEPLALTWEHLEPGARRHFTLDTPPLAEGGTHTLSVILVIASRYKGLEEEYAFTAAIYLTVSGQDTQQLTQHINLSGAHFDTGGLVNVGGLRATPGATTPTALSDSRVLLLDRAERYEIENGIRGYREKDLRVLRDVELNFRGFPAGDSPPNGATLLLTGRMACGRNSRTPDPSASAIPNDLCLRAHQPKSGAVDEPATLAISRHHFDLVVVNDRLCVLARTTHGMDLNGEELVAGQVAALMPGDRVSPIPGRPDKLTIQVNFSRSIGSVDRIDICRIPAMAP